MDGDESPALNGSGGGAKAGGSTLDVLGAAALREYLLTAVPLVLGGDVAHLRAALTGDAPNAALTKFIDDAQVATLIIRRSFNREEGDENAEQGEAEQSTEAGRPPFEISLDISFLSTLVASCVLVKRSGVLTSQKALPDQLRILTLSEGQPFEALHAYIHHAFGPYLQSLADAQSAADKLGIKGVKKAVTDMEMSLMQLQQDIDIPEITLVVHPIIKAAVEKARKENRRPDVQDLADKADDPQHLNSLQKIVARWIREIQKVTRLERDPSSGTALQEVSFWMNLERSLQSIKDKRDSPEVTLTLDVLKHGRRFHATVSFDSDTGLAKSLETVADHNMLMKDFPLNGLLTATTTEQIRAALVNIFSHLKKIRNTKYPINRALKLVQAISKDVSDQLLKVLNNQRLMHISHTEFSRVITGCRRVFNTWEEEDEKFRNTLRDLLKKKRDDSVKALKRIIPEHKPLQDRLEQLSNFRRQHEQLHTVIVRVLQPGSAGDAVMDPDDAHAISEVNNAYDDMKEVDPLNLTDAGINTWEGARDRYDQRISRVEDRITTKLRDQLGTAKTANEMFRIFDKYRTLFVRTKIRAAIREYQSQLIQRVKTDIGVLQQKFRIQYANTLNSKMSGVRDIPPVSGQIIWARQIDRQVTTYLQKLEEVLGRGWEAHSEGKVLKEEGQKFRDDLDTAKLFEAWRVEVEKSSANVAGHIFAINQARSIGIRYQLAVNFDPYMVTLSKEVRNLKWLGFRVPLLIVNKSLQANHHYPFAVSLKANVRTYQQTLEKLEQNESVRPLVASYHKNIQDRIAEVGMNLRWESYRLESFVHEFSEAVFTFQDKVDHLLAAKETIDEALKSLDTCELKKATLHGILDSIQKVVDELTLRSFVNLVSWVKDLDKTVESKLATRLGKALGDWILALEEYGKEKNNSSESSGSAQAAASSSSSSSAGDRPKIQQTVHEIVLRNQVMVLLPPVEAARENLLRQLQKYLGVITDLPRIQSSRYAVGLEQDVEKSHSTYRTLLTKIPATANGDLLSAYRAIEARVSEVREYVKVWLQYQSLWDMRVELISQKLGDDMSLWKDLLKEIKRARRTFDTSESSRSFGPVQIDYAQVQARVNLKYDALHKDLLAKFGAKIGTKMSEFNVAIQKARNDLESRSIDTASTSEAVEFISILQDLKRKVRVWTESMSTFQAGQKILESQRFQFPSDWLPIEQVQGEWEAFGEILDRKNTSVQGQMATLQMKVVSEDRQLEQRITRLLSDWDTSKPVGGDVKPDAAVNTLAIYESRFEKLKDEYEALAKAKSALDLEAKEDTRLQPRLEELKDLKSSWSELSRIWTSINDLRQLNWSGVVPRKIRHALQDLVDQLKNLPARVRSYASYEFTMGQINNYLKANTHIVNLRSDALKERHWKQLLKQLKLDYVLADMTLGNVWDIDLVKNQKLIEDTLTQAQGENALEEFLKQIKEEWVAQEVELVNYQNKTRLIKGWDDLFAKVKEHINSLQAMKMSPYFKVFEEDATAWDDKLNRIFSLFDVWMDVQRQWVYLEGIFSGSADIKHLLPTETSRFQTISSEFLALMKAVVKAPQVLEVLAIPNAAKTLERLADLLNKIQKALGEYLERERSEFPRFYFVGDEDLLEIIGNSKNMDRLQKHFRKMFAGVHSITLNEEQSQITGIAAKEGEEVLYKTVVACKDVRINEWLTKLESEMRVTLASLLAEGTIAVKQLTSSGQFKLEPYLTWLDKFQTQLVVLAAQVAWSEQIEAAVATGKTSAINPVEDDIVKTLSGLADTVLLFQPPVRRKKLEHMITELVHQRDVTRDLVKAGLCSANDFEWLKVMRFYFNPKNPNVVQQLTINMANTVYFYGFEYLGLIDKLVQTPLTDRCFLTMTQALDMRQGGSPFGPAGTGKTESVKALGAQLGRFVLVFNCDEAFDFHAMGRIFVGLCQVGAWGCFDEFNRLEERMLSAVSQQIQTIQLALKEGEPGQPKKAEILGRTIPVHPDMACFITMNPGYAGRSNLPDNLKKLFRPLAMTQPDRQLIAQVMLYSQGFRTAEVLSKKIVPLFILCSEQLSAQSHYDFGLRSLKAVLVSAGNVKRDRLAAAREEAMAAGGAIDEEKISASIDEQEVLLQSITQTMIPKLVADDIPLLQSLLSDVFPGASPPEIPLDALKAEIEKLCLEKHFVISDKFMTKMLQIYQVSNIQHGLMLVGPSGSGKSAAWHILLEALERLEKVEGVSYVIDPKAISKEELYGYMDATTREWTDGLLTHVIRKIIDNQRGELNKRQWIIFDGDVDPEWVENLNSVLDDNKLLTLPNGERLALPKCIRLIFEVKDLRNATLATVSRCGMVWFSDDTLSLDMYFTRYLRQLRNIPVEGEGINPKDALVVQQQVADLLEPYLKADGLAARAIQHARSLNHIMDYMNMRAITALNSMLNKISRSIIEYNMNHPDFPMKESQIQSYALKRLVFAILWSLVGDSRGIVRAELSTWIRGVCDIPLPPGEDVMDYEVQLPNGDWAPWKDKVPRIEIESKKVSGTDVVVPTLDTVRHEDVLYTWLSEHLPIALCGPPGSGKTMTLFSALRALPHFDVAGLNFSSSTTPDLILKTFDQYCEYRRTPNGVVLAPTQLNKWLVVFMDECNLPAADKYETVKVITFVRQLVEQGGFWRTEDHTWIKLERIQFVGACNPPTDPGRVPLDQRFLRHVPVVYVDYPGPESLRMIYGTFNRAMLRLQPSVVPYADALTNAMVDFFTQSSRRFTADMQPHYIYSPREMTRWVKGVAEAIEPLDGLDQDGLVRLWAHEALRLFQDRLVFDEERAWTNDKVNEVARTHFPSANIEKALERPILYSNWLSKIYVPVKREELREYVKSRLKVFYEEELDVQLVLFDEVLDHVLRIDRVFKQNQGHMLLIGMSGAGKTTLSRFVAWMNGLSVFQVKVHNQYTADVFDEDLRNVLRRSGTQNEKIVFIMDEGNVADTAFLERMNTLLANGEVPGLFEGDEFAGLMTACKEAAQKTGLVLDGNDELYKWFSKQVMNNLHVVFTMNPSEGGLQDRASTSPALFNRCVLNWFGDWSDTAVYQVGYEFTLKMDLEQPNYVTPIPFPITVEGMMDDPPTHRQAIIDMTVFVHKSARQAARRMMKREGRSTHITPRHYLDFINQMVRIYNEKRADLEEQQLHLNNGLQKINDTFQQVAEEQKRMAVEEKKLQEMGVRANQKLQEVLTNKEITQKKQEESTKLEAQLVVKQKAAAENKAQVEGELAGVEPAVQEAKAAVSSIQKKHLQELKALSNPPPAVKVALEGVLCMLGEKGADWKTIRAYIMRDDFIPSITDFDPDRVSPKIKDEMEKTYLTNPDFSFEKANRASQAAGPLVKWATAMVSYTTMLLKIEPLRNELKALVTAAEDMQRQHSEVKTLLTQLEGTLSALTEEYNTLQKEIGKTEDELSKTRKKVDRSVKLLDSLKDERDRWSKGSKEFDSQMATIVGDSLLTGAFIAYSGYFDQNYRKLLMSTWKKHLGKLKVHFKSDLAFTEYLSTADERLQWKTNGLPEDLLCTENAIMIKRHLRYPLIIDPAGQAVDYVMKQYADIKITKTSFLDKAFRKNLESALRFGTPLLVQDAENYDSLLNPVLNREVKKMGGRTLITIADTELDLSPSFSIMLTTRNPAVQFAPDVCSRVTLVNFTVTRGSLQSQCLNQALRSERPEVDKKRSDMLKLQGEFKLRLRQLENDLLRTLNAVGGSILDDDTVIAALEKLKSEAAEVSQKVADTDTIMEEVNSVTKMFIPLSQKCSAIYFTLEQMHMVHFLYRFSLQFFMEVFNVVLGKNPKLQGVQDHNQRLEIIKNSLFTTAFERVAPGLMHEHRMSLAMVFAYQALVSSRDEIPYPAFSFFMSGSGLLMGQTDFDRYVPKILTDAQARSLHQLAQQVPAFQNLRNDIAGQEAEFEEWMKSPRPELRVPPVSGASDGGPSGSALVKSFHQLLFLQAARPDRVLAKCHMFVDEVFGQGFGASANEGGARLERAVQQEITASTPVLLVGTSGYDASGQVRDLCLSLNQQIIEIAIGSAEGFDEADKAINLASKSGKWVLLKNVHLGPGWLVSVEKKLLALTPSPTFRLFMTTEVNPKLPVNLLRISRLFVFEPAAGVKASMVRTLNSIPQTSMNAEPVERGRVHLLLCWLHSVILERLRYTPLGWSKKYEFGDSDFRTSFATIDLWMDRIGKGRSHVDPEKIPWGAIRTLLAESVYGGRIDNETDQRLLRSFIGSVFNAKSFEEGFALVPEDKGTETAAILAPEGTRREQFLQWAGDLPDTQSPTWLGLPANAEMVLLTKRAIELASDMQKLQTTDDEDSSSTDFSEAESSNASSAAPPWMRAIQKNAEQWLKVLPESLTLLERSAEKIKDPLFRFFEREVTIGANLLKQLRSDLKEVIGVCVGEVKQTNYLRALMADLVKGIVNSNWLRYKVPKNCNVSHWIVDFAERVQQLQSIANHAISGKDFRSVRVWLGGLFVPEAYVTATRQSVAQAHGWALEKLELSIDARSSENDVPSNMADSFLLKSLRVDGATLRGNVLELISAPFSTVPLTVLKWSFNESNAEQSHADKVKLPVYLNTTRTELIFSCYLKAPAGVSDNVIYSRGVAMMCSSLGGSA